MLTPVYLGQTVPALTGRQTWVGIASWTPDFRRRVELAGALFGGELSVAAADAWFGGRSSVSCCRTARGRSDLTRDLLPMLVSVHRFGCATVYQVDASWSDRAAGRATALDSESRARCRASDLLPRPGRRRGHCNELHPRRESLRLGGSRRRRSTVRSSKPPYIDRCAPSITARSRPVVPTNCAHSPNV